MLMTIRDKAQGWIAWVIVILISIPFALFGISEYLGVGDEPLMAQVNDREITENEVERASFRLRNELRQRLGTQYKAELFEESLLRKQVLDGIIRDTLIQQAAANLGLSASDLMLQQTIMSIPAFQVAGQFNQEAYKRAVQLQGQTEKGFENNLKNSLVTRQLEVAIKNSSIITPQFSNEFNRLNSQKRKVSYLTLTTLDNVQAIDPDAAAIKEYYDNNASRFMADERIKVDYILLNLDTISQTLTATEDDLLSYYQNHKSEFIVADKKRLSHILFEIPEGATEEEIAVITNKAESTLVDIKQGKDFSELAKQISDDISSSEIGGDLGFLEADIFDKDFEAAANSLTLDTVSEIIRTRFGLHLIKVTELIKGSDDDFESVKDQVEKNYLKDEAEQIFYDYAERLSNLAYETPDSLSPASEDLNVAIQQSDWITRSTTDGIFASTKVSGAAFGEEVLTQGLNSEAIELSPTELVVIRVAEHEESTLIPFDQVKKEISDHLKQTSLFTNLKKHVDQLLVSLGNAETFESIAASNNVEINDAGYINRDSTEVPFTITKEAFKLSKADNNMYSSAVISNQEIAILMVEDVKDGSGNKEGAESSSRLVAEQANNEFELYVESLRKNANIQYMTQK